MSRRRVCSLCGIDQPLSHFLGKRQYCEFCVANQYRKEIDPQRTASGIKKAARAHFLAEQKGRCAICGEVKKLCIDHDHKTGLLRGLLCTGCNLGLGCFQDNMAILAEAQRYLRKSNGIGAAARAYLMARGFTDDSEEVAA